MNHHSLYQNRLCVLIYPGQCSYSSTDPYVKVSIFCATKRLKKKKTSTKHNTVHPVFNEALVFGVMMESLRHLSLEFQVIHENRIGQNEVSVISGLGEV